MARPDPSTMSNVHLLDEYLIVFRDAGRRHMACRIELERRLAELDRLRAIEAAARAYCDLTPERADETPAPLLFAKLQAALAAKDAP